MVPSYDLKTLIAMSQPYIGVRGYRLLKRAAVMSNIYGLLVVVYEDSVIRGGDPVPMG